MIRTKRIWWDSAVYSMSVFGVVGTLATIVGESLKDIGIGMVERILGIILCYVLSVVIIWLILNWRVKKGVILNIRDIEVEIKIGDIFKENDWKIIPFNEYYDTKVDEKIIASSTLNGMFIENYVSDINDLNRVIKNVAGTAERKQWKLGDIITYHDYMLLAFTHFNEKNVAHISKPEYEQCLLKMWREIRRVYANKKIAIPLLGSGITSFDDLPTKSEQDLLRCMLCTLRASGENINQSITIVLTKKSMEKIDLYKFKGEF